MSKSVDPNRFEDLVDIDTDGAVLMVGLQHRMVGPPSPGVRVNTGAIEVVYSIHYTELDKVISALKEARKALKKLGYAQ